MKDGDSTSNSSDSDDSSVSFFSFMNSSTQVHNDNNHTSPRRSTEEAQKRRRRNGRGSTTSTTSPSTTAISTSIPPTTHTASEVGSSGDDAEEEAVSAVPSSSSSDRSDDEMPPQDVDHDDVCCPRGNDEGVVVEGSSIQAAVESASPRPDNSSRNVPRRRLTFQDDVGGGDDAFRELPPPPTYDDAQGVNEVMPAGTTDEGDNDARFQESVLSWLENSKKKKSDVAPAANPIPHFHPPTSRSSCDKTGDGPLPSLPTTTISTDPLSTWVADVTVMPPLTDVLRYNRVFLGDRPLQDCGYRRRHHRHHHRHSGSRHHHRDGGDNMDATAITDKTKTAAAGGGEEERLLFTSNDGVGSFEEATEWEPKHWLRVAGEVEPRSHHHHHHKKRKKTTTTESSEGTANSAAADHKTVAQGSVPDSFPSSSSSVQGKAEEQGDDPILQLASTGSTLLIAVPRPSWAVVAKHRRQWLLASLRERLSSQDGAWLAQRTDVLDVVETELHAVQQPPEHQFADTTTTATITNNVRNMESLDAMDIPFYFPLPTAVTLLRKRDFTPLPVPQRCGFYIHFVVLPTSVSFSSTAQEMNRREEVMSVQPPSTLDADFLREVSSQLMTVASSSSSSSHSTAGRDQEGGEAAGMVMATLSLCLPEEEAASPFATSLLQTTTPVEQWFAALQTHLTRLLPRRRAAAAAKSLTAVAEDDDALPTQGGGESKKKRATGTTLKPRPKLPPIAAVLLVAPTLRMATAAAREYAQCRSRQKPTTAAVAGSGVTQQMPSVTQAQQAMGGASGTDRQLAMWCLECDGVFHVDSSEEEEGATTPHHRNRRCYTTTISPKVLCDDRRRYKLTYLVACAAPSSAWSGLQRRFTGLLQRMQPQVFGTGSAGNSSDATSTLSSSGGSGSVSPHEIALRFLSPPNILAMAILAFPNLMSMRKERSAAAAKKNMTTEGSTSSSSSSSSSSLCCRVVVDRSTTSEEDWAQMMDWCRVGATDIPFANTQCTSNQHAAEEPLLDDSMSSVAVLPDWVTTAASREGRKQDHQQHQPQLFPSMGAAVEFVVGNRRLFHPFVPLPDATAGKESTTLTPSVVLQLHWGHRLQPSAQAEATKGSTKKVATAAAAAAGGGGGQRKRGRASGRVDDATASTAPSTINSDNDEDNTAPRFGEDGGGGGGGALLGQQISVILLRRAGLKRPLDYENDVLPVLLQRLRSVVGGERIHKLLLVHDGDIDGLPNGVSDFWGQPMVFQDAVEEEVPIEEEGEGGQQQQQPMERMHSLEEEVAVEEGQMEPLKVSDSGPLAAPPEGGDTVPSIAIEEEQANAATSDNLLKTTHTVQVLYNYVARLSCIRLPTMQQVLRGSDLDLHHQREEQGDEGVDDPPEVGHLHEVVPSPLDDQDERIMSSVSSPAAVVSVWSQWAMQQLLKRFEGAHPSAATVLVAAAPNEALDSTTGNGCSPGGDETSTSSFRLLHWVLHRMGCRMAPPPPSHRSFLFHHQQEEEDHHYCYSDAMRSILDQYEDGTHPLTQVLTARTTSSSFLGMSKKSRSEIEVLCAPLNHPMNPLTTFWIALLRHRLHLTFERSAFSYAVHHIDAVHDFSWKCVVSNTSRGSALSNTPAASAATMFRFLLTGHVRRDTVSSVTLASNRIVGPHLDGVSCTCDNFYTNARCSHALLLITKFLGLVAEEEIKQPPQQAVLVDEARHGDGVIPPAAATPALSALDRFRYDVVERAALEKKMAKKTSSSRKH